MNRALLVIDLLEDFTHEGAPLYVADTRKTMPAVQREVAAARARGEPVIYVCDAHAPDDPEFALWPPHAVRGSRGARVDEAVAPEAGDLIVEKTTYSAFYGTALETLLREHHVSTVRLTGCVTHICILYTAMESSVRGFAVEVVRDGVAGLDPGDHQFALRNMHDVIGARII